MLVRAHEALDASGRGADTPEGDQVLPPPRDSAGRGRRRGPGERQAGGDLRGSEDEGRAQRAGAVPGRGRGGVGAAGGGWTGGDGVSRPDRLTSINTSENAQHS